ncbi:MAG: type II secretion system F family protein [Rickettsiales bacterium]|jgi:type II secretory pathway component PulF|nr:type II secretion system F family protein [Rickettsiales bacterium]
MPDIQIRKKIPKSPLLLELNRLIVNLSNAARLRVYYKLAALLRNRFTLMDALDRIWSIESNEGRKPDEPIAIAVAWWSRELEKGLPFSAAITGWAPLRERLMLSVGDMSKLERALLNVIKVSEGSNKILAPLINALTYPAMMVLLSFAIIAAVGIWMVPPMVELVPNIVWRGSASSLVAVSGFMRSYWWIMPAVFIGAIVAIYASFANLTGPIRVLLDKMPPWSLYRMFTGVSWLMSLAALVESGTPIAKSMQGLRQNASPYLRERIDRALGFMKNGANLGTSLKMTGMHFPDDVLIGDLEIYSELDNFESSLNAVATEYLNTSVERIRREASILNSLALIFVSGIIAWVLLGTFEMQNQVQAAL